MDNLKLQDLIKIRNNPQRIVNYVLDGVQSAISTGNMEFNSNNHPFLLAIDTAAALSYASINRIEDAEAALFPYNAKNVTDIYRHMSDEDFYGLFAIPSETVIQYAIPVDEIDRLAVKYEETSGTLVNSYRKLCIPADTTIKIENQTFSVVNKIEIRILDSGGTQVVYDSSYQNPFFPLQTNLLEKNTAIIKGNKYLFIDVPVKQLSPYMKRNLNISKASGLKGKVSFNDYLYGVVGWIKNATTKTYKRVSIVYDNSVVDPDVLTVVITLDQDNQTFSYSIPDTYVNSGAAVGTLELMYYTTKGYQELDLSEVQSQSHVVEYTDLSLDNNKLDKYSAPIKEVDNSEWKIMKSVSGGAYPRTFEQIKANYRYLKRGASLPLSDGQLTFDFSKYGYELVKVTDYATGRLFKLTNEIPDTLTNGSTINCFTGSLSYSLQGLKDTGVVYDNSKRVTIPPNTLVKISDEYNLIMNSDEITSLNNLSPDEKVEFCNNNFIVSIPFYYVLDTSSERLDLRTYVLDSPSFKYQNFLYERAALGVELGVGGISITTVSDGYEIMLVTKSDSSYKDIDDDRVGIQLSLTPISNDTLASIKGELYGKTKEGERIWKFKIKSNFDVNSSDNIVFNNLYMFGEMQRETVVGLDHELTILFLIKSNNSLEISKSDLKINSTLFADPKFMVMSELSYKVSFGKSLTYLYKRARPLKSTPTYKRYTSNVVQTYDSDQWKRDDNGQLMFDEKGLPILTYKAGDVMKDINGDTLYKHYKGDYVLDDSGALVRESEDTLIANIDIVAFDGIYQISDDVYDKSDYTNTKNYLANNVMQDMDYFQDKVLDVSKLLYQPKKKIGYIPVVIDAQQEGIVKSDLSFQIKFYLTTSGYTNETLRETLNKSVPDVINKLLKSSSTLAKTNLIKEIKAITTDEVIDFKINIYSGPKDIEVVTNLDGTTGFSIRKILKLTGDSLLSVNDSIVISFVRHLNSGNYTN